jgi:hypothetical protein
MQQKKVIKNISEVGRYLSDSNILLKTFENMITSFRLTDINKTKEFECKNIF